MIDNVLTLNAGSSSLKFAVFGATSGEHVRGKVEGFGSMPRFMVGRRGERKQEEIPWKDSAHPATVEETLDSVLAWLRQSLPEVSIDAVGHRIVHGGPNRSEPVLLDNDVLADLGKLVALAPLHQPHNLAGVEAVRSVLGELPQVACFDSAFHRRHPWVNDVFGLPLKLYEEGVRRYGFHGISYEYVHKELHRIAPLIAAGRVVVAHLGNGRQVCQSRNRCLVWRQFGVKT